MSSWVVGDRREVQLSAIIFSTVDCAFLLLFGLFSLSNGLFAIKLRRVFYLFSKSPVHGSKELS